MSVANDAVHRLRGLVSRFPESVEEAYTCRTVFAQQVALILGEDWKEWGPLPSDIDGNPLMLETLLVAAFINRRKKVAIELLLVEHELVPSPDDQVAFTGQIEIDEVSFEHHRMSFDLSQQYLTRALSYISKLCDVTN